MLRRTASNRLNLKCYGAAIVQVIPAGKSKKFGEYADKEFANYLVSRAKSSSIERIDVVFDVYRQKSIKASTREDEGIGRIPAP